MSLVGLLHEMGIWWRKGEDDRPGADEAARARNEALQAAAAHAHKLIALGDLPPGGRSAEWHRALRQAVPCSQVRVPRNWLKDKRMREVLYDANQRGVGIQPTPPEDESRCLHARSAFYDRLYDGWQRWLDLELRLLSWPTR